MQPGEVSFFLAAFPYGYGRAGRWGRGRGAARPGGAGGSRRCARREPDVPPEAPLLFEVTLLEVRDSPDPGRLPPAARLRLGAQKRERGNVHFARGDFAAALRSYRLALRALDGAGEPGRGGPGRGGPGRGGAGPLTAVPPAAPAGPQEEEELREQRVKCLNNCAAAARRLQRGGEALAACEAALRISPDNGKALLRRGQVRPAPPRTAAPGRQRPPPAPPLPSRSCWRSRAATRRPRSSCGER